MTLRMLSVRAVLAVSLALLPRVSAAQVFGQYASAEPVAVNGRMFGVYLHTSDTVLGAMGQLRLSIYPGVDFGFQGGLARLNLDRGDRTTVRFGTDVKAEIVHAGEANPFAAAIDGAIGVETSDEVSVLTLAPGAVVSRSYALGGSSHVVPYVGAQLAFARGSVQGSDRNDFSLRGRLGAELDTPAARFVFELQILPRDDLDGNYQVVVGANLPF